MLDTSSPSCVICGTTAGVTIRDYRGLSYDRIGAHWHRNRPPAGESRDKDGWKIFYCVPCAKEWLFPLIDERAGNTEQNILHDMHLDGMMNDR